MLKKIRFIEPGNRAPYRPYIWNFLTYNRYIRNPSTGLITLATIAREYAEDTMMYSESISYIDYEDVYDSDIVFISISTYNALRGYEIARKIRKNSSATIVFGGMQASLNYTETVNYCDYMLTGDGDESIIEFIKAVENNNPPDFPGIVYMKDGRIINTGKRIQPENTNTVPDRSIVYGYSMAAGKYDTLWPQVHASRGCPHNCAYCSVIEHFGRKIRKRSPESIIEDIKQAIEFQKENLSPELIPDSGLLMIILLMTGNGQCRLLMR